MAYFYSSEEPQPTEKQMKQILKNIKVCLTRGNESVIYYLLFPPVSHSLQYPHHVAAAKQVFSSLDSLPDLKTSIKEYS